MGRCAAVGPRPLTLNFPQNDLILQLPSPLGGGIEGQGMRCDPPRVLDLRARKGRKVDSMPAAIMDEVMGGGVRSQPSLPLVSTLPEKIIGPTRTVHRGAASVCLRTAFADSTACRAMIPRDVGPAFHGMQGHDSTASRAG